MAGKRGSLCRERGIYVVNGGGICLGRGRTVYVGEGVL